MSLNVNNAKRAPWLLTLRVIPSVEGLEFVGSDWLCFVLHFTR